jgi:hypothetical protein
METIIDRLLPFVAQVVVTLAVYIVSRVIIKLIYKKKLHLEKQITMKGAMLPVLEMDPYNRLQKKLGLLTIVSAPTGKGLLFQLPLLLAFNFLSWSAVGWVFIAAFIFMLGHAIPPKLDLGRILYAVSFNEELQFLEEGPYGSFDENWTLYEYWQKVVEQIKSLSFDHKYKLWLAMKQPKYLLLVFAVGLVLGFTAVTFQSLAIPIFIHFLLNLWSPSLI